MSGDVVRDIPEDMVERAAQGMATASGRGDIATLGESDQDWFRSRARAALSAALAGRTVVDLPEPNVWHPKTHTGGPELAWWPEDDYEVQAKVLIGGKPYVRVLNNTGSLVIDASDARFVGAAILAAGPAAERLAAGATAPPVSLKGGEQ